MSYYTASDRGYGSVSNRQSSNHFCGTRPLAEDHFSSSLFDHDPDFPRLGVAKMYPRTRDQRFMLCARPKKGFENVIYCAKFKSRIKATM